MSASRPALALCLALAVSACGKKNAIEYPVSLDQVTPWEEEGRKAIDPPRDANGKVIEPRSSRQPVPPFKSLPIDIILN